MLVKDNSLCEEISPKVMARLCVVRAVVCTWEQYHAHRVVTATAK